MKSTLSGIHDLPFAEYLKLDAINKSGLDEIAKSPAHFQAYLKQPPEPTIAMEIGTCTHYAIFQPELVHKNFFARPEGIDGRTKEGKAKLQELGAQNAGKTMLLAEQMAMVEGIMKAVRSHRTVSRLISGGQCEMSAIAQDPEFQVLCKARPDYLTDGDTLIDVKTTNSAEFRAFQRSVVSFRYHVQAAWYLDVVNAAIGREQFKRFIILAIEKEAPYGIVIYEFDSAAIAAGRAEARANLRTFSECKKKNEWPGYPAEIQIMTVPEWA